VLAGPPRSPRADSQTKRLHSAAVAVVVLIAALALAACGDEEQATSTTTVTAPSTEATTTTTPAAESPTGEVVGETPNGAAAQVDPATGEPLVPGTATTPSGAPATSTTPTAALPPTTSTVPAPATPSSTTTTSAFDNTEGILRRPFSDSSPWNTKVTQAKTDDKSPRLIRNAQTRIVQVEQPDGTFESDVRRIREGLTINVTRWTVPVFSDNQPGAVERIAVCRQLSCGMDAVSSLVIPLDACPDPRFDGWMTVLDVGARTAYDLWRARCELDGSLSYHYVKAWELDGPGFQQPGGVSARGSGLPLFAGLITPAEVQAGRIDHALAISVPGAAKRKYVQPASRTDGVGSLQSLPEGTRLRLREGAQELLTRTFVRNKRQRAAANTIITALERYGAIVVDRSAAPTLYAQRNYDWGETLPLNLIQDIPLSRFSVMDIADDEILFDPPREGEGTGLDATGLPPGAPSSIPGTTSGSQGATDFGTAPDYGGLVDP